MKRLILLLYFMVALPYFLVAGSGATQTSDTSKMLTLWHYNAGTSNVLYDTSGNGYNGSISGAVWKEGLMGQNLLFDGSNDKVTFANKVVLNFNFTIMGWFKRTSGDPNFRAAVIGNTKSNSAAEWIVALDNGFQLIIADSDNTYDYHALDTTNMFDDDTWHHFAYTRDVAQSKTFAYLDGVYMSYHDCTNKTLQDFGGDASTVMGVYGLYQRTNFWWGGDLEEIAIFKRCLTTGEIQDIYSNQKSRYYK